MAIVSRIKALGGVPFPAFAGERIYMQPFRDLREVPARWQDTVEAMLAPIKTDKTIYLMVDQKAIFTGEYHRRPGAHVDGNWIEAAGMHRNPDPYPSHRHPDPSPGPRHIHAGTHYRHTHGGYAPELLILASNIAACRAYLGEFDGEPDAGGSCDHFDLSGAEQITLEPYRAYCGTATTIHETIPVAHPCHRTVVRLNIPGAEFI